MPSEHPDPVQWDKVAAQLRAAREAQQRTWGDLDNATLGRYLADEASSTERAAIESAIETLPELKLLTDLVRDVLAESETAEPAAPIQTPVPVVAAATIPFRRPVPFVQKSRWGTPRQRAAILVAACLFLALGTWLFRPGSSNQPSPQSDKTGEDARAEAPRIIDLTFTPDGRSRKPGDDARADAADTGTKRLWDLLGFNQEEKRGRPPAGKKDDGEVKLAAAAKVVEEKQRELDTRLAKGDRQEVLDAARDFSAAAENRALEEDRRFAPKVAAGWNSVGLAYADAGDYDQAVNALNRAFEINRKKLGEKHEVTRQTCYRLTTVMNDGLALRGAPGAARATGVAPTAPDPLAKDDPAADKKMRDEGRDAFRTRMNRPEMQAHVKQSLLPYLVSALQDAPSAQERVEVANALGNLGAIAQDAQPVVVECLQQARDPKEQFALVWALNQMGPPNEQTVPALARTLKSCQPELRRPVANYLAQAPAGQAELNEWAANGKAAEKECAREALQRPRGGR